METSFSAMQEAMVDQIKSLELQCNAILGALRAENHHLRQALLETQGLQLCNEPVKKEICLGSFPSYLRETGIPLLPHMDTTSALQAQDGDLLESFKFVQASTPRDEPSEVAQPETPRQLPFSSEELCVTPGRSNGMGKNHMVLQIVRQPGEDVPAEPFGVHFEGIKKPVSSGSSSSSLALGFGNIVEIMSMGGKDIIDNSPINRWALLFAGITIPKQSRNWLKVKTQERQLGLRPLWTQIKRSKSYTSVARAVSSGKVTHGFQWAEHSIRVGSTIRSKDSCMQLFTVHPDHKLSWAHAVLQGVLILFDVIDFPLSAFHLGQTHFADVMLVISTCFWSWDVCLSFLQGFHTKDGVIEMRPSRIAFHYIRRWLVFDLAVVALDWVSLIVFMLEKEPFAESRVARATKFRRISRIIRGGRIVRLAKAFERIHALVDATASGEWIVMIVRIFGLVVMILLINHYVACAWYAIAEDNADRVTWLKVQMIEHMDAVDKYFYSLHWALTQFTPCTNNIAPANGRERLFASIVVLFALVVFSAFLSSLTTAIMQIKKLNFERYSEEVLIREFMMAKQVPLSVANQIWHFFRKHYRLRNKIVQESDVHFFAMMPKSLRRELRTYVYIPAVTRYPVLRELVEHPLCPMGPQLCEVMSSLIPVSGHDVFLAGDFAMHMYYFINGTGNYVFNGESQTVQAPDYVCEAVLWLTEWQHPGRLTVSGNRCEIFLLDVARFLEVVDNEADEMIMRSLRKYASLYAQHLEDIEIQSLARKRSPLLPDGSLIEAREGHAIFSDLPFTPEVRSAMCSKAFGVKGETEFTISGGKSIGSQFETFWRRFGKVIMLFGRKGNS